MYFLTCLLWIFFLRSSDFSLSLLRLIRFNCVKLSWFHMTGLTSCNPLCSSGITIFLSNHLSLSLSLSLSHTLSLSLSLSLSFFLIVSLSLCLSVSLSLSISAIFNLGYESRLQGVRQNLKSPQSKPIPVVYLYKIKHHWWYGGTQSVKTLLMGYAKE